jgi:hypothetical protein
VAVSPPAIRSLIIVGALFCSAALIGGCSSGFRTVVPKPPVHYEKLGQATGTARGSLGIAAPLTYFIPLGYNSSVERAYEKALASVPGATALIDVDIDESWFWWILGTMHTVTVSGEAIRRVD